MSDEKDTETETTETSAGLDENVAGALSYILGLLSGLFFYFTEEENEFVRFHALQSILFSVVVFVIYWVVNTIIFSLFWSPTGAGGAIWGLLSMVMTLLWLAFIAAWLFLMFKAYNGERFKLPILGDMAESNV